MLLMRDGAEEKSGAIVLLNAESLRYCMVVTLVNGFVSTRFSPDGKLFWWDQMTMKCLSMILQKASN